jgi:hypothetical protein
MLEIINLKTKFPSGTSKFSRVVMHHATKMYEIVEVNFHKILKFTTRWSLGMTSGEITLITK